MSVQTFKLAFSRIECSRCGIARIRGIECADCGQRPEPWEVNAEVLGRRQAATRAQALLSQSVPPAEVVQMDVVEFLRAEVSVRLSTWLDAFMQAAASAGRGDASGAEELEKSVSEFVELRAMIFGIGDRRPQRSLVAALRSLADALESMVDTYLATLLAESPLQAQTLARTAQQHLDQVAILATQAAAIVAAMRAMSTQRDIAQIQAALMTRALDAYQAPDLLALDTAGRDALQQLTSSRGTPGMGTLFAVHDVQARAVFDPDQFHDVLRRSYVLFRSNPTVLRTLAATPSFEEDFKRAIWELFDSSLEAVHATDNAVHVRQAGRALIGVAAALVEGPGQVMATALLLACGRKTAAYENLRYQNATDMVGKAQSEPALQGLLDGLDSDLRTGRAHALVRYEPDHALIERKTRTRSVAWPDVLDGVFQGHESVLACQLGLLQALGELGFTDFALDGLWRSLGLTARQMTTVVVEGMNCRDVTITDNGSKWHIEAHAGPGTALPKLVAMLHPTLPTELESLVFTAHQNDGTHVLAGPTGPWHDFAHTPEGEARQTAFLRAQLSWTYDGGPWLPTRLLRTWAAKQAAKALDEAPARAISQLRTLRELAMLAGDEKLTWTLVGIIRYVRLGPASDTAAERTQLLTWAEMPVTEPTWWHGSQSVVR